MPGVTASECGLANLTCTTELAWKAVGKTAEMIELDGLEKLVSAALRHRLMLAEHHARQLQYPSKPCRPCHPYKWLSSNFMSMI